MKPITKKRIQMACKAWDYFMVPAREYRKIPYERRIASEMLKINPRYTDAYLFSDFVFSDNCHDYDQDTAMALALWAVWEELE